jgi:hypothetical protein
MIFILMRECNRQAVVHCERKDNSLKYESTQKDIFLGRHESTQNDITLGRLKKCPHCVKKLLHLYQTFPVVGLPPLKDM